MKDPTMIAPKRYVYRGYESVYVYGRGKADLRCMSSPRASTTLTPISNQHNQSPDDGRGKRTKNETATVTAYNAALTNLTLIPHLTGTLGGNRCCPIVGGGDIDTGECSLLAPKFGNDNLPNCTEWNAVPSSAAYGSAGAYSYPPPPPPPPAAVRLSRRRM